LLLISGFISGVVGIFGNTYENGKITKNGKIVFSVLIIVLFLGMWQQIAEDKEGQERDQKAESVQHKIDSLQIVESKKDRSRDKAQLSRYENSINKLDSIINGANEQKELSVALQQKTNKLESLQNELYTQEKEVSLITKENYNATVGKDSYCYVRLLNYSNKARILLAREGKYSLQNIDFTISNPIKNTAFFKQIGKNSLTEEDFKQMNTIIYKRHINSLPANTNLVYDLDVVIPFNWPEDSLLAIDYSAPNNHWYQTIYTQKGGDGNFTQKSRITMYIVEKGIGRGKLVKEFD